MPSFERDGLRLWYGSRGDGPPIVLLHGLLWSSRMFERLCRHLPGYGVLLLDLHGHGKSEKPPDWHVYTWEAFAADVTGLLDHLGVERAVVGGLSLGANVALATAVHHPERCAGLLLEMPVLARGHDVGRAVFGRLAALLHALAPEVRGLSALMRRLPAPRSVPEIAAFRDVLAVDPDAAAALLEGLLADDPIPEDDQTLARIDVPALVIGHRHDPLHVLDDARELARRLPRGRFVEASSILEFRVRPQALAGHVRDFLAEVYDGLTGSGGSGRSRMA